MTVEPPETPPFAEPWQARAFAIAVGLAEQGHFTWPEFSARLAEAVRRFPEESYHRQWLRALEKITAQKGIG